MTSSAYLDSNIVIYLIEGSLAHAAKVTEAIHRSPETTLVTSDLVRMECLTGALRRPNRAIHDRYVAFLDRTHDAPLTLEGKVRSVRSVSCSRLSC